MPWHAHLALDLRLDLWIDRIRERAFPVDIRRPIVTDRPESTSR
jgi:hypothetical protein